MLGPDRAFGGAIMFKHAGIQAAIVAAFLLVTAAASHAEFKVCNKSKERATVSIGYNSSEYGWTSEGWWSVPIGDCVRIINGDLKNRYYYVYATGHKGGTWSGRKDQDGGFFCITKEKYTLHNREYQKDKTINCEKSRFQTKKFRIVDTEEATTFTYNLTE
jgi:uncharacterized membrane protein